MVAARGGTGWGCYGEWERGLGVEEYEEKGNGKGNYQKKIFDPRGT